MPARKKIAKTPKAASTKNTIPQPSASQFRMSVLDKAVPMAGQGANVDSVLVIAKKLEEFVLDGVVNT